MNILLIGNYPYLKSQSMNRFESMLDTGLKDIGWQVQLLKPTPLLGRIFPSAIGLGKWLGYVDRFLLFLLFLKRVVKWADVVHICDQANAVYVPWLKDKPHVVTCHDMLAIRSALGEINDNKTDLTGRMYQLWILSGLKRARHLACVSTTTQHDLLRLARIERDRTTVIYNGLNYPYRRMSEIESIRHIEQLCLADSRPFFLHVGGNYWYKNRVSLFKIFSLLPPFNGRKYHLVLAGEGLTHELRSVVNQFEIHSRIREAPNVTNEQLCALYSSAEGLIFPSLAEGFGWPIIESQACGCPVFASNRKALTEIGGDGAVYFDPKDEKGAAEIIWNAIKAKEEIRERGYKNAEKYSTENMISGYLKLYRFLTS